MLKLRCICYIFLMSKIHSARLAGYMNDGESLNEEDNKIKDKYNNNNQIYKYFDNDDLEKIDSRESIEKESKEQERIVFKEIKDIDESKEDVEEVNAAKEELNNKIDNSKKPTKKEKELTIVEYDKDDSSYEISTEKTISHVRHDSKKLDTKKVDLKRPDTKKLLFRNCRDRTSDDLCRNTLIDYPYAASIQRLGSHYATGALLNKRWIVTVAGEFYNTRESIKLYRARLGSVNCKRGGISLPLQEVAIHPLYVPGEPGYDLGLIRLGELVKYSDYIKPIKLSVVTERVISANFLTMYWPRLVVKGETLPRNASERAKPTSLRVSTQKLVSSHYCHKMMLDMNVHLQEASLCLKPLVTHHSLCKPDPGAPIVADDGLWGVTSGWTSNLCYKLPGPTIFTRTSAPLVSTWLEEKIQEV
ncbi:coagulation factor XI-like isoform X2 [Plodia interpunctella]|uniref:coagulation factor XI-like isoform X2 n=1 Tax=Plodia interpunctella TaxID=58824 RepID=UPI0023688FC4|nr:coagulation factor XI-like isoform X2 [Plodia interpunctella]